MMGVVEINFEIYQSSNVMTSFAHLDAGLSADAAESPSAELNLLASSPTGADLRAPTQVSARPELGTPRFAVLLQQRESATHACSTLQRGMHREDALI